MGDYQQQGFYAPPGSNEPSLPSGATTIYILAFLCMYMPIAAPVVWYLAREELRHIDAGEADPRPRRNVDICRIIALVLTWIVILAFAGLILMTVAMAALPFVINALQ